MAKNRREKKPRVKAAVSPAKLVPSPAAQPGRADDSETLVIRIGQVDVGGPWCLSKATPAQWVDLLQHVTNFESMRVRDLFWGQNPIGLAYDLDDPKLHPDVKPRLDEIGHDDEDTIDRLRVNGPGRLYGFRRGREFWTLWWDPDHEVYESKKKHT